MRFLALAVGLVLLPVVCGSSGAARADAVNYPWCAYLSGNMGGSSNCGFSTVEQCQADVSGVGGFCMQNPQYQPPAGTPSSQASKRHRQS